MICCLSVLISLVVEKIDCPTEIATREFRSMLNFATLIKHKNIQKTSFVGLINAFLVVFFFKFFYLNNWS